MLIGDLLRRAAQRNPKAPALLMTDGSGSRTYAELHERANRLANALSGLASSGDRVAILSENRLEYVEAYYGVPSAGMALTTLNPRLHPKEWVWILNNSGARVLLVQSQYREAIADHLSELTNLDHIIAIGDPVPGTRGYEELLSAASDSEPGVAVGQNDVAWVMYTSGTTGFPKGAQLTHNNLITSILQSALEYEVGPHTRFLNAMPLCHVAGYLTPVNLLRGGSVLMMPGWDPEQWMQVVQQHRVTSGGFAPTMMSMLLAHDKIWEYDLSSLEWMGYGASKIPVDVLRRTIERFGSVVYAGMGMTELGGNILTLDRATHERAANGAEHLLDAVGRPMSLVDVRVVDADSRDCPVGEVGEIWVRGDQVTTGYLGNSEATQASFTDSWFHTGDLARRDAEGYLYIVDRAKDMIITGGENVYSSEVENALYEHPGIAEAAVVGLPHEVWGEQVAALVVPAAGHELTEEDVIGQCTSRLASYKRPREVIVVDQLPKTVSGKIRKNELRAEYGTAR